MVTQEQYQQYKRWRSSGCTALQAACNLRRFAALAHVGGIAPRCQYYRRGLTFVVAIVGAGGIGDVCMGAHPNPRIAYRQAHWEQRIMAHGASKRDDYRWRSLCRRAVWENWRGGI